MSRVTTTEIDVRSQQAAARGNLVAWEQRVFQLRETFESTDRCDEHARYVIGLIRTEHQDSSMAAASRLEAYANGVLTNERFQSFGPDMRARFAERLRTAAELERAPENSSPWREFDAELAERPRQHLLAQKLWKANTTGARTWRADLVTIKELVWGNEFQRTSTVRSCVHDLKGFFVEKKVQLAIRVRDVAHEQFIECTSDSE